MTAELKARIENEREWRTFMLEEFKSIKDELKDIKDEQKKQYGINKVLATKIGMLAMLAGIIGNQIAQGVYTLLMNK
jgi:hypothetical protein